MISLKPRQGILNITPYIGGKHNIAGIDRVIKLSSNEGALGPSPKVITAYQSMSDKIHRYPDGQALILRQALAVRHGLNVEQIVCGAGSDELLQLLVRGYAGYGDEVLYSRYGFLIYAIAAKANGANPILADEVNFTSSVDHLLASVTKRTRILFIANPNNPTGTYLPMLEMKRLRAELPSHVLLVIDSAYAEFVEQKDYNSGVDLVDAGDNVVMTRTFSKIYGMSGLRLGWAYCPLVIADVLNRIRSPFNISSTAIVAGKVAIEDINFVNLAKRHNSYWRDWLVSKLICLDLEVIPSVANFVLVRFPTTFGYDATAADIFLQSNGIIVRTMESYGLPNYLRITIGRDYEMQKVISTLSEFQRHK
ncbi:MAG: histidinol-phosphate transaminase [Rhodospirillaceae bacterium]|jgi:histidinol-phosphate aminotransferase|nr:histidinol-phosphate transaminase [Rhodospirillaceae bacterium]